MEISTTDRYRLIAGKLLADKDLDKKKDVGRKGIEKMKKR